MTPHEIHVVPPELFVVLTPSSRSVRNATIPVFTDTLLTITVCAASQACVLSDPPGA